MNVKPRKLKVRLAEPALLAVRRREAAKLDQAGLVRMKRQRKLLQPLAHLVKETPGVGFVLESDDEVVGIAHKDHVARGLAPSPALRPEIKRVVQVDIGSSGEITDPCPVPLSLTATI